MAVTGNEGEGAELFSTRTDAVEKAWRSHLLQYALSYCIAYRNFASLAPGMAALEGDDAATRLFHGQLNAACFALVSDSLVVAALAEPLLPLLDTRPALRQVCMGALDRAWAALPPFIGDRYLHFVLGAAQEDARWRQTPDLAVMLPDIRALNGEIFSASPFIIQTQLTNGHARMLLTSMSVQNHARNTFPPAAFETLQAALLQAPLMEPPANPGNVWSAAAAMELCFHLCMLVDPPIRHNGSRMRARVDTLHQNLLGKAFFAHHPSGDRLEAPRAMQSLMQIADLTRPLRAGQVRL